MESFQKFCRTLEKYVAAIWPDVTNWIAWNLIMGKLAQDKKLLLILSHLKFYREEHVLISYKKKLLIETKTN